MAVTRKPKKALKVADPISKRKATNRKLLEKLVGDRTKFANLVSGMLSRKDMQQAFEGHQFDGQRDLYAVLGYKRHLTFYDYVGEYDRGDIGTRIIDAPPQSTWRRKPVISNDGDSETFTEFEIAWAQLEKKRRVFHYLERADKLAGVGNYGVLLLGTDDVRKETDMQRPMGNLKHGPDSLLYLIPFMEGNATITEWETDPRSQRFGMPLLYEVDTEGADSAGFSKKKVLVHWSRLIHIAEGLRENDWQGVPRLQHVFNRLYDVAKISGGAAEIFWQAAKRILVLQGKDGYSAVDDDDALTEMMDELIHGLRRVIDVQGYDVKTLDPSEVKPDEAFRVCLALISSATGIPQRILLGSEQGKMASTQDEINWNGRIADRQINFAEPVILRPFIDRLIMFGALPAPAADYTVTWPSLFELSDKEKAQIGLLKARSIAAYLGTNGGNIAAGIETIVPVDEFRGEFLNLRSPKIEQQKTSNPGQADSIGGQQGSLSGITSNPQDE